MSSALRAIVFRFGTGFDSRFPFLDSVSIVSIKRVLLGTVLLKIPSLGGFLSAMGFLANHACADVASSIYHSWGSAFGGRV